MGMLVLPFLLLFFCALTSIYIYKKSKIFFISYLFLFMYTFFTQLGYLLYPDLLSIESHYQYYGEEYFLPYWEYVFASFIFVFLFFVILHNKKVLPFKIEVKPSFKRHHELLYIMFLLLYSALLTGFLLLNYNNLSYQTQEVMKNNKLWFYLFSACGIVLLSLANKIYTEPLDVVKKSFYMLITLFIFVVFFITCIKSGQRGEFLTFILALIGWYTYLSQSGNKKTAFKRNLLVLGAIVLAIAFLQSLRLARGMENTPQAFMSLIKMPSTFLALFSLKALIFQDWLNPSLTLMTSIKYNIVFPVTVILSNLLDAIPFIMHRSLGEILSRFVDPYGSTGYGYYILTEGYNLMGFAGFVYSAFIFVLGWRFWEFFFAHTRDKVFNAYMNGCLYFCVIHTVRSQSVMFLKGLYIFLIPAIFLFLLSMDNRKIYLNRSHFIYSSLPSKTQRRT